MIDDVPDTALGTVRRAHVDSRRTDIGTDEFIQVTMIEFHQLQTATCQKHNMQSEPVFELSVQCNSWHWTDKQSLECLSVCLSVCMSVYLFEIPIALDSDHSLFCPIFLKFRM